jgi:hypothetical protein
LIAASAELESAARRDRADIIRGAQYYSPGL